MIMGKPLPLAYIGLYIFMDMEHTLARPPQRKILKETRKSCKRRRIFFVFASTDEFQKSQIIIGIRKMKKCLQVSLKTREGKRSLGKTLV